MSRFRSTSGDVRVGWLGHVLEICVLLYDTPVARRRDQKCEGEALCLWGTSR